jgi:myo-inositol-1(or 4)-monophosphatase
MFPEPLKQLAQLVRTIADTELLPRFNCRDGTVKADGSLVTEADIVTQDRLIDALRKRWPEIAVLGEEMTEDEQQQALTHESEGVWCIDPLDGTSNFTVGVPYYAVSVALLRRGEVEMGVVYDPSRRECFSAARGEGAWLNGKPLQAKPPTVPLSGGVALIDLKRLPAELASRLAAEPPYKSQRSFGAVALDWCWLAAGRCHVYLHGQQKLWDYAAGCLILRESGGQALTLKGDCVFAVSLVPRSAAAALDAGIFREWTRWLGIPTNGQSLT